MDQNSSRKSPDATAITKEQDTVMKLIATWASEDAKKFPPELEKYLNNNEIRVTSSPPPSLLQLYGVALLDKIVVSPSNILRQKSHYTFYAHVVPMLECGPDGPIKTFPAGRFVTVDLDNPGDARVVVTAQLTGCSLVMGFDKKNKSVLYLGHAQPGPGPAIAGESKVGKGKGKGKEVLSDRAQLAKQFTEADKKTVFEGQEVGNMYVVGGDEHGYGEGLAVVLGWVSNGKFFLAMLKKQDHYQQAEFELRHYPKEWYKALISKT